MFSSLFGSKSNGGNPTAISAKEASEKLAGTPRPFLIDVREPYEYAYAHIEGATLIPLGSLRQRLNDVPSEGEVIVVCQSGSRSQSACSALRQAGRNAINLQGGMSAWMRSGLPVAKGDAPKRS